MYFNVLISVQGEHKQGYQEPGSDIYLSLVVVVVWVVGLGMVEVELEEVEELVVEFLLKHLCVSLIRYWS